MKGRKMTLLDEIIACLDDGATPLLQKHKSYIESALNGDSVEIPYDEDLCLSAFLVELGVIIAYLTDRPIFMLTHAVFWAHQATSMKDHAVHKLNHAFGERTIDMMIKVPDIFCDSTDLDVDDDCLVLTHGLDISSCKAKQCVHQDLGSKWDGMIRTGFQ